LFWFSLQYFYTLFLNCHDFPKKFCLSQNICFDFLYNIFTHYFLTVTIFQRIFFVTKYLFWFSLQYFYALFLNCHDFPKNFFVTKYLFWFSLQYFSTLFLNCHDFPKKFLLSQNICFDFLYNIFTHYFLTVTIFRINYFVTKYLFWFSLQYFSETFTIRKERELIKNIR